MYCPKCGFQLPDDATDCFVCGWKKEDNQENSEVKQDLEAENKTETVEEPTIEENTTTETEEVIEDTNNTAEEKVEEEPKTETLEDIKFESIETEEVETPEAEDEINFNPDDVNVDFDEIGNVKPEKKKGTGKLWSTAIISFLAGALCALLVVGCINGTVVGLLDRITNGEPKDEVKEVITTYLETNDSAKFTSVSSTYTRASLVQYYQQYASYVGLEASDFDFEVSNDKEYAALIKKLGYAGYGAKVKSFDNFKFYYTSSEEFSTYKTTYSNYADSTGIQMFASVDISFVQKAQETTTAETTTEATTQATTKKSAKNGKTKATTTTTAPTTTQATTAAQTTTSVQTATVTCVKIEDKWYVFTLEDASSTSEK